MLKPYGFFTKNPGLDVPHEANAASQECGAAAGAAANGNGACCHANGNGTAH